MFLNQVSELTLQCPGDFQNSWASAVVLIFLFLTLIINFWFHFISFWYFLCVTSSSQILRKRSSKWSSDYGTVIESPPQNKFHYIRWPSSPNIWVWAIGTFEILSIVTSTASSQLILDGSLVTARKSCCFRQHFWERNVLILWRNARNSSSQSSQERQYLLPSSSVYTKQKKLDLRKLFRKGRAGRNRPSMKNSWNLSKWKKIWDFLMMTIGAKYIRWTKRTS